MAEEGRPLTGAGEPIVPPRLEDAGLEDCALPPESIAEAFSLAAKALSSRLPNLSLSDDEDEYEGDDPLAPRGGCVEDLGPTCGVIPDALVGPGGGREGGADDVVVVGGGGAGGGGGSNDVVVVERRYEDDRVVVVGEELGDGKGCVEGIREEGEERKKVGNDEAEKVSFILRRLFCNNMNSMRHESRDDEWHSHSAQSSNSLHNVELGSWRQVR